jgi:hypothetical protein
MGRPKRAPAWAVTVILGTTGFFFAINSGAQVTAHHAEEPKAEADVEVASPMVVEVKLPPSFGSISPKPGSAFQKEFTETRRFVCDKARVEHLKVSRSTDKQGHAVISFEPKVSTGWYRQHVKLKLEVVAGEKTLLTEEARFVAGTENAASALGVWGSSTSKTKGAELLVDEAAWKATFADGGAPIVRMTLAIKE